MKIHLHNGGVQFESTKTETRFACGFNFVNYYRKSSNFIIINIYYVYLKK